MDRTEKMREYLKPYLADCVNQKVAEMAGMYKNGEMSVMGGESQNNSLSAMIGGAKSGVVFSAVISPKSGAASSMAVSPKSGAISPVAASPKSSLLSLAAALFHDALVRQDQQPQWRPAYLGLFHLSTGLLTGSHEYELILADTQMYLDEFQITSYWQPGFFCKDNEAVEMGVRKELGKKFTQLNEYEISDAKQLVFYEYRNIAGVYWREHLDEIIRTSEFEKLKKNSPFQFLFGDYMGEAHAVLNYGEG